MSQILSSKLLSFGALRHHFYSLSHAKVQRSNRFRSPTLMVNSWGVGPMQVTLSTYASLKQLGQTMLSPARPSDAVLERVLNPHPEHQYVTRFVCPEFTSICPVTSQPDFAHIVIDYVPAEWLIESKSLKLYLASFRNHPDFHEACSVSIATRLVDTLKPSWLRLGAYWYPRGGMPIDVFFATGDPPKGVWIPEQGCPSYRGRG